MYLFNFIIIGNKYIKHMLSTVANSAAELD